MKAVFSPEEVERYGAEIESARQRTTPDDPTSWWSVTADGHDVVTRINYLGRHSSLLGRTGSRPTSGPLRA